MGVALLVLVHLGAGCSLKPVRPAVFGNEQSAAKVLIAADASDFKGAVVKQLVEKLVADGAFVRLAPLSDLSKLNAADYKAVVLVNTVIAWQAKPDVQAFIKRTQDRDRLILVSTAGDPEIRTDFDGVDAVTAASEMENAGGLADEIAQKVEKLL
ncbi:MAG: hypothetical protein AB1921_11115 [Thermodesulfobacteriota bacterium]